MATFMDEEFGAITVRRSSMSRTIKLSVAPNGTLRISMPKYTPMIVAKRFIKSSRDKIRALTESNHSLLVYQDGDQIGKSHHLHVMTAEYVRCQLNRLMIILSKPDDLPMHDSQVQQVLRDTIIKALRIEAKSYLPRRLAYLANKHGFSYKSVRFSHASSRWGSCSSSKTISLNIALMKLDFSLIDYVLIHELAHTIQLNHSDSFWSLVESIDSNYKINRKKLKMESPSI